MTLQERWANVPGMFSEGIEDWPDAQSPRRGAAAMLARKLCAAAAALLPAANARRAVRLTPPSPRGI